MRLWSIHPEYFDRHGLVAAWRAALLAQKVLSGAIKSPKAMLGQLLRFYDQSSPLYYIGAYLTAYYEEAESRGYNFHRNYILFYRPALITRMVVTTGQLQYEFCRLQGALKIRQPEKYSANMGQYKEDMIIKKNPIFTSVAGPVEPWEVVK